MYFRNAFFFSRDISEWLSSEDCSGHILPELSFDITNHRAELRLCDLDLVPEDLFHAPRQPVACRTFLSKP